MYKNIPFPAIKGLNLKDDQFFLGAGELKDCRNIKINQDNSIEVSDGYVQKIDNGAGFIPSMFPWLREDGTEAIYFIYTTKLYKLNSDYTATEIDTALTTNLRTGFLNYNDRLYYGNGTDSGKKYNGTNVRNWGIVAPSVAPTYVSESADGSLSLLGVYQFRYTYWNSTDGVESAGSTTVSRTLTGANNAITIGVTASADAQVTNIRIYRTLAGGAIFYYDQQVANATASIKSTNSDTTLEGAQAYYTSGYVPPPKSRIMVMYNNRAYVVDADNPFQLFYSENGQLGGGYVEYFPALNVLMADVAYLGLGVVPNGIITFEKDKTVLWAGSTPSSFQPIPLSVKVGCIRHETIAYYNRYPVWGDQNSVYFYDGSGIVDIGNPEQGSNIAATYKTHDKSNAFGFVNPLKDEYYIFTASSGTTGLNDTAWVYNFKTAQWIRRDTQNFLCGAYMRTTDALYVGDRTDADIHLYNSGTDHNGAAIAAYFQLGYTNFGDNGFKELRRLIMNAKSTGNITLTIYTENDSTGVSYTITPADVTYAMKRIIKYLGMKAHNGAFVSLKFANVAGSRMLIKDISIDVQTRAIP